MSTVILYRWSFLWHWNIMQNTANTTAITKPIATSKSVSIFVDPGSINQKALLSTPNFYFVYAETHGRVSKNLTSAPLVNSARPKDTSASA
ncbi:hypothetical protein STSP2_01821 [Anaerohalosphaera lusitana]|uniref:Uncharacterized protein n=1 Tax=Anaerohalosphaera lusitana TaxID=1936003 RepID=A0A1U9NL36_9BACT|nr:hypothetical protein STSP2_01821 [Anaerohalosphaera lusitana]